MTNNGIHADELASIRSSIHTVAEYVAVLEMGDNKLKQREKAIDRRTQAIEQQLIENEERINSQLSKMESVLSGFQDSMSPMIIARKRIDDLQYAEKIEDYLKAIHNATDEFIRCTDESYQRLNKAADYTVRGLSKAIHSFRMDDFQSVTTNSIEKVSSACETSVNKVKDVIRWFHWRNIGLVFSITIVVTMISGLYMNDEWPWESHQQIVQQRRLATAVESAWPHLTSQDQQEILQTATHHVT